MADTAIFHAAPKRRYAFLALVLSLLSTGLGQIYVGQTKRAWRFFITLTVVSLLCMGLASLPPSRFLAPVLLILIAVFLATWIYAGIVAFVAARRLPTIERRPGRWKIYLLLFVANCALASIDQIVGSHLKWRTFNTGSYSTEPTLRSGDTFVSWRSYFADHDPQHGDLTTVAVPTSTALYIRRIVGMPGDSVQMKGGRLYLQGKPATLEVDQAVHPIDDSGYTVMPFLETLPDGRRYGIGRIAGSHPFDDTAPITVPPGYYFVLGDSRNNSMDSRMSDIGLIPRGNLRDKPLFVLWSPDSSRIGHPLD